MVSFMKYVSVTSRCSAEYRNDRLADVGIVGLQYSYILNICRNPGTSQEELSHLIHVNKSNVTRQLASLEENGFIERLQSPTDKRVTLVYPTQKARDVLPEVQRVLREWNEYLTEGFTDEERETLSRLMQRVTERAVEYVEKGEKK